MFIYLASNSRVLQLSLVEASASSLALPVVSAVPVENQDHYDLTGYFATQQSDVDWKGHSASPG
jgi:hypothetical protein